MDDEITVDSKYQILRILYDLLKKRPFIMFMGLLVFVRGVIVIQFTIVEVNLTNDVKLYASFITIIAWTI